MNRERAFYIFGEVAAVALAFLALVMILRLCTACADKPAALPGAGDIVELGAYEVALERCRAEGKDAGSFDVYEACAKKADSKFGRKPR